MYEIKNFNYSLVNNITLCYSSPGRKSTNWDATSYKISYTLEEGNKKFDTQLEIPFDHFRNHSVLYFGKSKLSVKSQLERIVFKYEMIMHENITGDPDIVGKDAQTNLKEPDPYLAGMNARSNLKEYGYGGLQLSHIKLNSKIEALADYNDKLKALKENELKIQQLQARMQKVIENQKRDINTLCDKVRESPSDVHNIMDEFEKTKKMYETEFEELKNNVEKLITEHKKIIQ